MRKIGSILIVLALICFCNSEINAQECVQSSLQQRPGEWKASTLKNSTPNISPKDLLIEKAIVGNIQKDIASKYSPIGLQSLYSLTAGINLFSGKNWVADTFALNIYMKPYICDKRSPDKSKFIPSLDLVGKISIQANAIPEFQTMYAAELPDDEVRGYLRAARLPRKIGDFYFFGDLNPDGTPNETADHSWLITYGDTLPFSYVTRREYLQLTKKRLQKTMANEPDPANYYRQFMNNIDRWLKKSEAELSKPAICPFGDEERFTGFVEENPPATFTAVKPNMAYYRKNLGKAVPHFWTVIFEVGSQDSFSVTSVKSLRKAVDFNKLRNLLGK